MVFEHLDHVRDLVLLVTHRIPTTVYIIPPVTLLSQPVRRRVSMDGEMVAVRTVNKVDQLHISSKNGSGGDGTTSDENDVVQSYYRYVLGCVVLCCVVHCAGVLFCVKCIGSIVRNLTALRVSAQISLQNSQFVHLSKTGPSQ